MQRLNFHDLGHAKAFFEEGYTILDLLTADEQAEILAYYHAQHPERRTDLPLYHSVELSNVSLRHKFHQDLLPIISKAVARQFDDVEVTLINFVVKFPNEANIVGLHQDWTIVDEDTHQNASLWVGLQDIDRTNGCLKMVPGSHHWFHRYRGTGCENRVPTTDEQAYSALEKLAQPVPILAGQAITYDVRLFHGSDLNKTDKPRIGLITGVRPKGTKLFHYYRLPHWATDRLERLEIKPEFLLNYTTGEDPAQVEGAILRTGLVLNPEIKLGIADVKHYAQQPRKVFQPHRSKLLRDAALHEELDEQSQVVIDLLSAEQIAALQVVYQKYYEHQHREGFHATMFEGDGSLRANIRQDILAIVQPTLDAWFEGYQPIVANFVVKAPGPDSEVPPHQDWTFVDETKSTTLNIWCPLVDTNEENGWLGVVKGSHRFLDNIHRGSPITPQPYDSINEAVKMSASYRAVKAGQAMLYENRTIHCSPPNLSEKTRVVVVVAIARAEDKLFHYHIDHSKQPLMFERFEVDTDFFNHYDMKVRPEGVPLLDTLPVPTNQLSETEWNHLTHGGDGHLMRVHPMLPPLQNTLAITSKRSIFRDEAIERRFHEEGFLQLHLLEPPAIQELTQFYFRQFPEAAPDFFASTWINDVDKRKQFRQEIFSRFKPALDRYFQDYDCWLATYMTKTNQNPTRLLLHQDLTMVEEKKGFMPINVWCALVDITPKNGALRLLHGGNKLPFTFRYNSIPCPYLPHRDVLDKYMVEMLQPAGYAALFSQSVLHDSEPNTTDQIRLVAEVFITHKDSKPVLAYAGPEAPEGKAQLYAGDREDFFMHFDQYFGEDSLQPPKIGTPIGLVDYPIPSYTPEQMEGMCEMISGGTISPDLDHRLKHPSKRKAPAPVRYEGYEGSDIGFGSAWLARPMGILRRVRQWFN
jgi:ectoine hydroxylase-related dioxygenase (phytanoyl-CoA dioxygenase family)